VKHKRARGVKRKQRLYKILQMPGGLVFKQADKPWEFEQIHSLNYRTFVEEIRQYPPDGSGLLVDRFHDQNIYCIAVQDGRVLGMVAAHEGPPFSVETRLRDPSILASLKGPLLEVRLLALDRDCRHRMILAGLLWELYRYACERRYSHLIISGITGKARMYERFGFRALGPAVASGGASFVPMAMSLESPAEHVSWYTKSYRARQARSAARPPVSLMAGPVEIAATVRQSFVRPPVSHRSAEFVDAYERARGVLARLSGGMKVAIFTGSGTTANDSVALHLRAAFENAPGLVLVNGEFGERIARQASRAGLQFQALRWAWGEPWDLERVADAMTDRTAWVWAVHLETSAGVLNPLPDLVAVASSRGVRVAADCVSSIGAAPLPAHGIWMSTGVSGKAIGAYAGLSFVFASDDALEQTRRAEVPSSFDVRAAAAHQGPRFTMASPLLFALESALASYSSEEGMNRRFARLESLGRKVRSELMRIGIQPLARERDAAPCVTTFVLPYDGFIQECRRAGFELGAESAYLRNRGWAQIATMGAVDSGDLDRLFSRLNRSLVSRGA
jgi:aspartate aminotransferase-like enzyme